MTPNRNVLGVLKAEGEGSMGAEIERYRQSPHEVAKMYYIQQMLLALDCCIKDLQLWNPAQSTCIVASMQHKSIQSTQNLMTPAHHNER